MFCRFIPDGPTPRTFYFGFERAAVFSSFFRGGVLTAVLFVVVALTLDGTTLVLVLFFFFLYILVVFSVTTHTHCCCIHRHFKAKLLLLLVGYNSCRSCRGIGWGMSHCVLYHSLGS